jgi:hypothetical protein
MKLAAGFVLAAALFAICGHAEAASSRSCAERFAASGIDPSRLGPGDHGRLEGYEFVVAKDDTNASKICDRVDAEKAKVDTEKVREDGLRSQIVNLNVQLSRENGEIEELKSGGPLKQNYLIIDGCLLAWAVIASIWAAFFAGRLGARRH